MLRYNLQYHQKAGKVDPEQILSIVVANEEF